MDVLNILVTGGLRGIGAGIVEQLGGCGHRVAFCGRGGAGTAADRLAELRSRFPAAEFAYYRCDVSSASDRAALLDAFEKDIGPLDMLVNNAGVAPENRADLLDMSEDSFDRVLGINLRGPFFLTQAAARRIIANRDGRFHCIVNVGSVSAVYASVNRGEYCISKAGVAMSTKLFAARLADDGVAVYEIRPGVIHSDMTACVREKYDAMISGGLTLQRRWGEPADAGRAVAALASGALAYSTGQVINIDGGLTVERF